MHYNDLANPYSLAFQQLNKAPDYHLIMQNKTVLVIDDSITGQQLISSMLMLENTKTICAADARKGLELAAKEQPDLILLDIMMPEMNGFTCLRKLKSNIVTANIPVIVISARISKEDHVSGLSAGAFDYINKPFSRSELILRVKNILYLHNIIEHFASLNERLTITISERDDALSQLLKLQVKDKALSEFAHEIQSLDRNHIYSIIPLYFDKIFGSNLYSLFLYDQFDESCRLVSHNHPDSDNMPESLLDFEDSIIYATLKNKEYIFTDNFQGSPYKSYAPSKVRYSSNSAICLPMMYKGRSVGALCMTNKEDGFDEHDIVYANSFLEYLSRQLFIIQLTTHDYLTGLSIRREIIKSATDDFAKAHRYKRNYAILMGDLDKFKTINDTYGHQAGDLVLRCVASTLAQDMRGKGVDRIGRYGGEEILITLPETDLEGACKMAERLRLAVAQTKITYKGIPLSATISFGVAAITPDTSSLKDLIGEADIELYKAKAIGRNCISPAL